MNNLPEESIYSFKKGVWFVFKDGTNFIRFWISNFNGQEKLYLNNEIVSEKKNLTNFKTKHQCITPEKDLYEINFGLKKRIRNCELIKNGKIIGHIALIKNKELQNLMRGRLLIMLSLFALSMVLVHYFDQPSYFIIIAVVIGWGVLIPTLFSSKPSFIFENNEEFID